MDLVLDWFLREGGVFISWGLLVTIAGWTVMPLCWCLLGGLPDRGYTLSKPLGMLLIGFVYWLLVSLGLLDNSAGSILLAWGLTLIISLVALARLPFAIPDWRTYWRENRTIILASEALFFVLFLSWLIYRAHYPDTFTTEKPMELAFISGIMRSDTFPPNDSWLSGFAISYYYFGYLMTAMLALLSGVSSSVAFSAMLALLFALAGVLAFGVVANMVRARQVQVAHEIPERRPSRWHAMAAGLLATFFVVLMGNFQLPLIEMPFQMRAASPEYLNFWAQPERSQNALDTFGYSMDPDPDRLTDVSQWNYWWWFRGARVLADFDLEGNIAGEPISEFPAFSFVLGDVHPHVLSLPFVMMTLGLGLNLLMAGRSPGRYDLLLLGLVVGGLIFLNTWDGPIYLAALVGVEALRRVIQNEGRLHAGDWLSLIVFGAILALIALIAYLPFFIGFRSQAAGLLPNLIQPTYFPQLFIMMGPVLLLAGAFTMLEVWRGSRAGRMNWSLGIQAALGALGLLILLMLVLTFISALVPELAARVQGFVNQYGGWGGALPLFLGRRLAHGLTTVVMLLLILAVVGRLFARPAPKRTDEQPVITYPAATGFALLLVGIGASLILVPEYIYLRDVFVSRINTIFKFYYQAWVVLGLASAYGAYTLLSDVRLVRPAFPLRFSYGVLLIVIIGMGSLYPIMASYSRAYVESGGRTLSIDGGQLNLSSEGYAMVQCLADLVEGDDAVVAEASRHQYRANYGRVGTITGIPIVLGWPGHQNQWRGATYPETVGSRQEDLTRLYTDNRWESAQEIIDRYGIDYVVVGSTERQEYEFVAEDKFMENGQLVCEFGTERVYRVAPTPD